MRIWLITVGEPLPIDGFNDRLHRTGILANMLAIRGHEVVWWTSTVDHIRKRQRFNKDTLLRVNDHFQIRLLHSLLYKRNISLMRIVNHYGLAHKFSALAVSEQRPDIILCSLPPLELSLAATKYGKERGIPVVLDIRDLWPDLFLELVPRWTRGFAKLLLSPFFRTVRSACAQATAIIGVTPAFVEWGIKYANRIQTRLDRDFPLGYSEKTPSSDAIRKAEKFWDDHGIKKNKHEFICCFFGTMGRQFELKTVIEAARQLSLQNRPFRFILCGTGDNFAYYKNMARDCHNIIFPGWVGEAEIWTLSRMSSAGLAPYRNITNFMSNLPNKPIEYLSAGLPVISSLRGSLERLLATYECGITYDIRNHTNLASLLINLYDNPERLKRLSENASRLYRERFVAERIYADMIRYMEGMVKADSINPREWIK